MFKAQLAEMGQLTISGDPAQCYSDSNVGWGSGRPTLTLGDGTSFTIRVTGVFHKEQGDWKLVQWHGSLGAANDEVIGKALTTE